MAGQGVFFITGKLGSGKSLVAVGKIRDKLLQGCPVATNLDIRLDKLIGNKAKKTRLYRVPDKPTSEDLAGLGSGNDTYDDSKNGLIVLDECGTWFNARSWQDKDRGKLLAWLLHARKLGWDIMFIIQDVSMIDKQARKSVAEHVVYCRRLDKLSLPFIEPLIKTFTSGSSIPKPKMHLGIVKYGDLPTSITVDRWFYRGTDLYPAYDTKQMFMDDYPHSLYQVLPPYYSHGRYAVKHDLRYYMRITKIHLKRFSRPLLLVAGLVGGMLGASYISATAQPEPVQNVAEVAQPETVKEEKNDDEKQKVQAPPTLSEKFEGFTMTGVARDASGEVMYVQIGNGMESMNLGALRSAGYVVRMVSPCEVLIMTQDRKDTVRLYTTYCGPEKPPAKPPRMTKAEQYQYKLEYVRAIERINGY